jgi:hypothetical protein
MIANIDKMSILDHQDMRISAREQVIKELRNDNLNKGNCFMVFDDDLDEDQAYYEYPGGQINIEQINKYNIDSPRLVIKKLSKAEITSVRLKHEVFQ